MPSMHHGLDSASEQSAQHTLRGLSAADPPAGEDGPRRQGLLGWKSPARGRASMSSFGRRVVEHLSILGEGAPWFAGWGTLALINAALAQGKNRSGLIWFLLSLPLGPLATLLLVLLPKVRSKMF